jgi:hypothetical protein
MNNPNDEKGGNPQINSEQSPRSLSEAGRSFFDSLNAPEGTPGAEAQEAPANSSVANSDNTPAAVPNADSLEAIKQSIISEIQSLKQQNAANNPASPEDPQAEEGSEGPKNEIDMDDDEFMEQFSENPVKAVVELANKIADQKVSAEIMSLAEKVKSLLEQSEQIAFQNKVKDTLAEFANMEDYKDADKYFPEMAQIIREKGLPQDDINSFISTYKDVALKDLKANQGKSLDDYLTDDNHIPTITSNPKIREQVIREYLQEIANGGKPAVITSGGSASPAATPPTQINSFEEARKAFRNSL